MPASATDRTAARRLVEGVAQGPPEMEAHRWVIIDAIDAHPDIADRTCRPGHLTGSALVMDAAAERTVLLLHRKLGRWLQPGGHADGDFDLVGVALREAYEETGIRGLEIDPLPIDLDIHEVRPPGESPHLHLDVRFLIQAPAGAEPVSNDESDAIEWVDLDRVADLTVPEDLGIQRLVSAARLRLAQKRTG